MAPTINTAKPSAGEKRPSGFGPVNDQEKQLNDGDEEAGQSPPNTLPEGGDQESQAADDNNDEAKENDQGADSVQTGKIVVVPTSPVNAKAKEPEAKLRLRLTC